MRACISGVLNARLPSEAHMLSPPMSSSESGMVMPGHTTLSRMPWRPTSRATLLLSAMTPALQAAYTPSRNSPMRPASEPRLTMAPDFRAIMPSRTARVQLIMPQRLSWISFSHSARSFSTKSRSWVQPTLFTSTSTWPRRLSSLLTMATTDSHLLTSVATEVAEAAPRSSASATTFLACPSSISAMVRWTFSRAKARLMARPIFEPPPVTMTLLPARFSSIPFSPLSSSGAELAEVHGALLDEGVAAFHGFVRLIVKPEGGVGELGDPGALLGVDIEGLLGEGEGRRALLEEGGTPLLRLGAEVLERHHLVHEPHVERLLRRVLQAQVPDLARLLLAHDAGQIARAVPGVHAPHARTRLAEDGRVRRDREIAEDVQDVAAADGEAVDHGDDGLGNVADRAVKGFHVHGSLVLRVAPLPALLLIAARAEGLVAGAREHGDPDGPIPARIQKGLGQLGHRAGPERVPDLGPIDGDPGHAVHLLVEDIRVAHGASVSARASRRASRARPGSRRDAHRETAPWPGPSRSGAKATPARWGRAPGRRPAGRARR